MASLKMFKNEIADQIFFKHYWSANMERTFLNFPTLFGLREIVTKENQ